MPRSVPQSSPCCVWDFTSFDISLDRAKGLLCKHSKKWTFQLEVSPTTGTQHLQGRMSLKQKARLSAVKALFPQWHLSITSTENRDNNFYVTKEDSRLAGPFTNLDVVIPRHLLDRSWFPWQQRIIDAASVYDENHINLVCDKNGLQGKSIVAHYIAASGIGSMIPAVNCAKDIMRLVLDKPKKPLYVIDVPRAISQQHYNEMWAAIETVKAGYAYDDRYSFKEAFFDRPQIWVFANDLPPLRFITQERWKLWEIDRTLLDFKALTL